MTYKRQDAAFKRKICRRVDELRMERMSEDLARILEELRAEQNINRDFLDALPRKGRTKFPFKHFGDRVEDKR